MASNNRSDSDSDRLVSMDNVSPTLKTNRCESTNVLRSCIMIGVEDRSSRVLQKGVLPQLMPRHNSSDERDDPSARPIVIHDCW